MSEKVSPRKRLLAGTLTGLFLATGCSAPETQAQPKPTPEKVVTVDDLAVPLTDKKLNIAETVDELGAGEEGTFGDHKLLTLTYSKDEAAFAPDKDFPAAQELSDALTGVNEVLLEQAHRSGYLDVINVEVNGGTFGPDNDDGYMSYSSASEYSEQSGVTYTFQPEAKTNVGLAAVMTRHETLHALLQGTDMADKAPGEVGYDDSLAIDKAALGNLCTDLRERAIGAKVAATSAEIVQLVRQNEAAIPPELKPAVEAVTKSLENGSYTALLPQENADLSRSNFPSNNPSCLGESPTQTIVRLLQLNAAHDEIAQKSNSFNSLLASIDTVWVKADSPRNPDGTTKITLTAALREATYLQQAGMTKNDNMGHWWDNANELGASALTIALSFPREFDNTLGQLSAEERSLVQQAVVFAAQVLAGKHRDNKAIVAIMSGLTERYDNDSSTPRPE